jgi:hypothetical protein
MTSVEKSYCVPRVRLPLRSNRYGNSSFDARGRGLPGRVDDLAARLRILPLLRYTRAQPRDTEQRADTAGRDERVELLGAQREAAVGRGRVGRRRRRHERLQGTGPGQQRTRLLVGEGQPGRRRRRRVGLRGRVGRACHASRVNLPARGTRSMGFPPAVRLAATFVTRASSNAGIAVSDVSRRSARCTNITPFVVRVHRQCQRPWRRSRRRRTCRRARRPRRATAPHRPRGHGPP